MTTPIKLEARNLREVWDKILPGLVAVKEAWPELSSWRVEDVYASVLAGDAVIYTTEDGFAVCAIETDEYSLEKDLFIWIAHSYKEGGGMIQKYLPSFIEVAKRYGCRGVTTVSNHPALAKVTAFKVVSTEYRVLVDGESS